MQMHLIFLKHTRLKQLRNFKNKLIGVRKTLLGFVGHGR